MVKKTPHTKIDIEKILARAEEHETNYKRVLADYQNQERRLKESQNQFVKYANATLLEKILLNIDSLEMAQNHLKSADLEIVIKQLLETLKNEGLTSIESNSKLFDPITMDCIEVVPGKKDQVIETMTKGYLLFDKVLRPAKVKVGSGAK
jgi:molecular chaperone GrpE